MIAMATPPSAVLWILGTLEVILLAAAAVVWVRTTRSRFTGNRWVWLAALCLVSIVGPTAFLLFGRRARPAEETTSAGIAKADQVTDLLYGPRQ